MGLFFVTSILLFFVPVALSLNIGLNYAGFLVVDVHTSLRVAISSLNLMRFPWFSGPANSLALHVLFLSIWGSTLRSGTDVCLGEETFFRLLLWIDFWTSYSRLRIPPSYPYAGQEKMQCEIISTFSGRNVLWLGVEQYLPEYGQSNHLHATSVSLRRNGSQTQTP